MRKPFKTSYVDGDENVMVVDEQIKEIRFNIKSRDLSIVLDDCYTQEDLDGLSWQGIKKLVIAKDGSWTSKSDGIEYLIGRSK